MSGSVEMLVGLGGSIFTAIGENLKLSVSCLCARLTSPLMWFNSGGELVLVKRMSTMWECFFTLMGREETFFITTLSSTYLNSALKHGDTS